MSKKNTTNQNNILKVFNNLKSKWYILIPITISIVILVIFNYSFFYALNPDAISYFNIANNYANFDFKSAINGYWSPFLSWIITPFIWIGLDPLFAYRIINFFIVLSILILLAYFLNKHAENYNKYFIFASILILGSLFALWSTSVITPDFLSGYLLLLCILIIKKSTDKPSYLYSVLAGALLALLYFSKSIGLYISISLLVIIFIYFIKNKISLKYFSLTLLIFLVFSFSWITLISIKYNKVTISTASEYNFSLIGPSKPAHPHTVEGYHPLNNYENTWIWDDPSYINIERWSPIDSPKYYLDYIIKNFTKTLEYLFLLTPLMVIAIYGIFIKKDIILASLSLSSIITILIYTLVLVESRYIWLIAIPILFYGLTRIPKELATKYPITITLILVCIYSIFSLLTMYINSIENMQNSKNIYTLSKNVPPELLNNKTVASSHGAFITCYITNSKCVANISLTGDSLIDKDKINSMKQNGIQYYLEYSNNNYYGLDKIYNQEIKKQICGLLINKECSSMNLSIYKIN